MTLNEAGKISPKNILYFSTMPFKGEIQYFEYTDIYMEFRYAFPLQKSTFLPTFENKEENIYGRKKYNGILFSIAVPNNIVFVRHPRVNHAGKTLLAQTAIVMEQTDFLDDDFNYEDQALEDEKKQEIDRETGLPVINIYEVPVDAPETKKGKSKIIKNKRYRTLSFPNYYLCRVSW